MFNLIRRDPRFPKLNRNRRKVIYAWASREYKNLHRARDANVLVPAPYLVKDNILLMEYIGDSHPAPKLKDQEPEDKEKFMEKVIDNMKKLKKANLVHGDLSPFNILNFNDTPYFIDFSQCIEMDTIFSDELLETDIKNMTNYFKKIGIDTSEEYIRKKLNSK